MFVPAPENTVDEDVQAILNDVALDTYLMLRKPTILVSVDDSAPISSRRFNNHPYDANTIIIAPMNTDLRWGSSKLAKRGQLKYLKEAYEYEPTQNRLNIRSDPFALKEERDMERGIFDDSDRIHEVATDSVVIPPLNTDIRITNVLPEFKASSFTAALPTDEQEILQLENFSWHLTTEDDNQETQEKKKLMHPVQNQHMCGSCWAMALSSCISDCFVVSGAVTWMPRIAPTFLMMTIPQRMGNGQCDGGNPAATALALESIKVADTTCIDYSWCANDSEVCTSSSAANHFKSTLGKKLNANIPSPANACYFEGDRYLYQIDKGSEALFISERMPAEQFRDVIKRHLVEFGPPLAGYAVLKNFVTGNFTDPRVNQGVYFDRADYPSTLRAGQPLVFRDSNASAANLNGLHAVEIVGWGLAKNIQYDTGAYGDVPFWWAKNSWGSNWGNMKGYFKMAMYPWNKYAQFGKQINVKGSNVGGMILVRCTSQPSVGKLPTINPQHLKRIVRSMSDEYYQSTPQEISAAAGEVKKEDGTESVPPKDNRWLIYIGIGVVVLAVMLAMFRK
jgi:hypothetical protein